MTETPNPHIIDADTLTGEMRPIRPVAISLGSNVGDRLGSLQGAVNAIADTPDVHTVAVSSVYQTVPVDAPEGSPDFLNAVLLVDTTLRATTLLDRMQAVEDAFGREHAEERNAPRTLDIDLLTIGDLVIEGDVLQIPHPRAYQRAFVLVPWAELDQRAEIPGHGYILDLLADMDTSDVVKRDDLTLDL